MVSPSQSPGPGESLAEVITTSASSPSTTRRPSFDEPTRSPALAVKRTNAPPWMVSVGLSAPSTFTSHDTVCTTVLRQISDSEIVPQ